MDLRGRRITAGSFASIVAHALVRLAFERFACRRRRGAPIERTCREVRRRARIRPREATRSQPSESPYTIVDELEDAWRAARVLRGESENRRTNAMTHKPLCFVLMPFGLKPDPAGGAPIDFDRVYRTALEPAIRDADMDPIRADQEGVGGIIHKPMFERLLFCEFAVADLTTANANVFYELGVRHAARPSTTLSVFAKHQPIPFDVNFLRALPYDLGDDNAFGSTEATALRASVTERLRVLREELKKGAIDSPVYQLIGEWKPGETVARDKTDVFREQVAYSETLRQRLAAVRTKAKSEETADDAAHELAAVREELGDLSGDDTAVIIDVMLSYRALQDWDGLISLVDDMPEPLRRQIMVREQLAFAINRRAGEQPTAGERETERERALTILRGVEEQQGASSETCGLIGRIFKDRWQEAEAGDPIIARGYLDHAIDAYRRGYRADVRDPYPGINALTLLDIKGDGPALELKDKLLPVVRYAVELRLGGKAPDYWDHATLLELAVLDDDPDTASKSLSDALALVRERWEPESTAGNLRMIQRARAARGTDSGWLASIVERLDPETEAG